LIRLVERFMAALNPQMALRASFLQCEQLKFEKFPFHRHLGAPSVLIRPQAALPNRQLLSQPDTA